MNHTLNLHGETRVRIPVGLPELISDISREVLHKKPMFLIPFIANYLEAKMKARDISKMATNYVDEILDDIKDSNINYAKYGITKTEAEDAAQKIQALYKGHRTRRLMSKKLLKGLRPSTASYLPTDEMPEYHFKHRQSVSSIAESIMHHVPSKLEIDDDNYYLQADNISVKSEYHEPVKATVLTKLPTVRTDIAFKE